MTFTNGQLTLIAIAIAIALRVSYYLGRIKARRNYLKMLERAGSNLGHTMPIVIALLLAIAPRSWSQIRTVTLAPAIVRSGDFPDHLDLALHRAGLGAAALVVQAFDASGARVSSYAASWHTSNPAIATVTAGTVVAKAKGAAMVSVTVSGGATAQLFVCVADTGAGNQPQLQQWPAVTAPEPPPFTQPAIVLRGPGVDTTRFTAIAQGDTTSDRYERALAGAPYPSVCLHWSSTSQLVKVDRWGTVTVTPADTLRPGQYLRVRFGPP